MRLMGMLAAVLAALAAGCASAGRVRAGPAEKARLPFTREDVESWRRDFKAVLKEHSAASSGAALQLSVVPKARELIGAAPAQRARDLSLQAFCVAAAGTGDPEAWALGCFEGSGPLAGGAVPADRRCQSEEIEPALRAAVERGGPAERSRLREAAKALFRCHQQNGTVGALTRPGVFAKGEYGLALSLLAWSRGLDLSLPDERAVDRAAAMLLIELEQKEIGRRR